MPPAFSHTLRTWYRANKRDLPWRTTSDPYRIWLSEVILQQTQVKQGLAYYYRFLEAFPNVMSLAAADEDRVLKLWQGLGYYSRARNLHAAAREIAIEYQGSFPKEYQAIRSLKGVGDYTAAAVASFAFGQPYAVVDGNVGRVLSRYFGITEPINTPAGKKLVAAMADEVLDQKFPAEHNQAIMEFGALHCTTHRPDCGSCIFSAGCIAHRKNKVAQLPAKKAKAKVRVRHFNYVVLADSRGHVLLNRRKAGDIWQGLYEFNLVESSGPAKPGRIVRSEVVEKYCGTSPDLMHVSEPFVHVLTHQKLHARFLVVRSPELFSSENAVPVDRLHEFAFPRLIDKFLSGIDLKEIL